MNNMNHFNELRQLLAKQRYKKRVAVVNAANENTLRAVQLIMEAGIADVTLVGSCKEATAYKPLSPYLDHIRMIDVDDDASAADAAVACARRGEADALMKGHLNTDVLLRALLNKEHGLLPQGSVMTHISVAELPNYPKLLFFSDAAVIPFPNTEQRLAQVGYVVRLCHAAGIKEPRVALIHCTEKNDERHFPFLKDYSLVKEKASVGFFGQCIIDGPLDLKTSCSLTAMQLKGIHSPIQGDADAVIMPDIESGNLFHKTLTLFAQARMASLLQGTAVPVALSSRGDTPESKLYSVELALLQSFHDENKTSIA